MRADIHHLRALLAGAFRIAGILALLLTSAVMGQSQRFYYTGSMGNHLMVQMELTIEADSLSGFYYYESVGKRLELRGVVDSTGAAYIEEFDARQVRSGMFRGGFDPEQPVFTGEWRKTDRGFSTPFSLNKVAFYQVLETQNDTLVCQTTYPVFIGDSPAIQSLNRQLADSMTAEHQRFVAEGRDLYKLTGTEIPFAWERQYDCEIAYFSPDLISLPITIYEFTGGAHGNVYYDSRNYSLKGDQAQRLKLADLFLPDTQYVTALSRQCVRELRMQNASWIVDGQISTIGEENLILFSITPGGIEFAFAPYAVGPFAEGSHFVEVPFAAVKEFINPDGPLAPFRAALRQ